MVFHYHSAVAQYLPNYLLHVRVVRSPIKTAQAGSVGIKQLPAIFLVPTLSELKETFVFPPLWWGNGLVAVRVACPQGVGESSLFHPP